jgi:hypothetical protein
MCPQSQTNLKNVQRFLVQHAKGALDHTLSASSPIFLHDLHKLADLPDREA